MSSGRGSKMFRLASVSERVSATFINLFLGTLPVTIPRLLGDFFKGSHHPLSQAAILDFISLTLFSLQFAGYLIYSRSPAGLIFDIKVADENLRCASRLSLLIRSAPWTLYYFTSMAIHRSNEAKQIWVILNFLIIVIISVNALSLMFFGRMTIIDTITKTRVVRGSHNTSGEPKDVRS